MQEAGGGQLGGVLKAGWSTDMRGKRSSIPGRRTPLRGAGPPSLERDLLEPPFDRREDTDSLATKAGGRLPRAPGTSQSRLP